MKSWDHDDILTMILYFLESAKEFESKIGMHNKDKVTNLFSNF